MTSQAEKKANSNRTKVWKNLTIIKILRKIKKVLTILDNLLTNSNL